MPEAALAITDWMMSKVHALSQASARLAESFAGIGGNNTKLQHPKSQNPAASDLEPQNALKLEIAKLQPRNLSSG